MALAVFRPTITKSETWAKGHFNSLYKTKNMGQGPLKSLYKTRNMGRGPTQTSTKSSQTAMQVKERLVSVEPLGGTPSGFTKGRVGTKLRPFGPPNGL